MVVIKVGVIVSYLTDWIMLRWTDDDVNSKGFGVWIGQFFGGKIGYASVLAE